jgi:queuine tRNA-ribosyltransferase
MRFELVARSEHARAGLLHTRHAVVPTPAFMPVATQATVKGLEAVALESLGVPMVIMNTYHLWLRPGAEVIARLGGLHEFSRMACAVVTDSGGFQAFSLSRRTKVSEAGVEFQSHLDGQRRLLSPEEAMRVQGLLGSDIAMQLDICPPGGSAPSVLLEAVERTTRWAKRCLEARDGDQALFGIVQGGTDLSLRLRHADKLSGLPLDGLALGGFSVGEPNEAMHATLQVLGPSLDPARPHYLMGVGTPSDIVRAIGAGVDMFDCVMPTRNARNGQAFVRSGKVVIKNARYKEDPRPLDPGCKCPVCREGYSRAFIRHAYQAGEMAALRLLTLHNLYVYQELVTEARGAITQGDFARWAHERLSELAAPPTE